MVQKLKKNKKDHSETLRKLDIIKIDVDPSEFSKRFKYKFDDAWKLVEDRKIRKYTFFPSGRVVWTVQGKEKEYQILPASGYCDCLDFYFETINNTSPCKHLVAFWLAKMFADFRIMKVHDRNYDDCRNRWADDYRNDVNTPDEDNKVTTIIDDSNEPQYKATHAFRYTSKIPADDVGLFCESLKEWEVKVEYSPKDRAQQVTFRIPDIGHIAVSKSSGTIVVDTKFKDPYTRLRPIIGKPLFDSLIMNKMQSAVGIHIPKIILSKIPQTITTQIEVLPGILAPFTVTVRDTLKYIDVHTHHKIPKYFLTPGVLPNKIKNKKHHKRRIKTEAILQYARKKGFIMVNDAKELGIRKSSLRYHLNKLVDKGLLIKKGNNPITYFPITLL